jgi:hypothetical protein
VPASPRFELREIGLAVVLALLFDVSTAAIIALALAACTFVIAARRTEWAVRLVPIAPLALAVQAGSMLLHAYNWLPSADVYGAWCAFDLVVGLLAAAAVTSLAFELGGGLAIFGAVAWLVGWAGVAAIEVWAVRRSLFDHGGAFPDLPRLAPLLLALGGTGVAVACARAIPQPRRGTLVAGCVIVAIASAYGYLWPGDGGGAAFACASIALAIVLASYQRLRETTTVPRAIISTTDSR